MIKKTEKIKGFALNAGRLQEKADEACQMLVNEILLYYKKGSFGDLEDEERYIESISIFRQAGDGLMVTDEFGSNVPVRSIIRIIYEKKYFDYNDLMRLRI